TAAGYRAGVSLQQALAISFAAVAIYIALAAAHLGAQGLYFDELHQATAAFAYCGQPTEQFCPLSVRGIPVLNMTYSGAIKTAVYGLYLRCTGMPFSVTSWRLLGIVMTAVGLVFFAVVARPGLTVRGMGLFFLFLLTDASVLLHTRHDWGPVALALLFRFL